MAAELVVGALLSSLFDKLFKKLASRDLRSFFRGLKVNEGLPRKLKTMLWSANQVLDDAEQKQLTNPNVREWLFELRDTIYDAEDVLDEIDHRSLQYEHKKAKPRSRSRRKRFQSFINCFNTFDEAIERKIEEILDRLKYIIEQKNVLRLQEGVTSGLPQRLLAPSADESSVFGRNDDKEKIIQLLLPDDGNSSVKISVIPIVGMGGIGKTTLAQLVFEDERVKNQFEIRSWVIVSDESDISKIAKQILEEIISKKCEIEGGYQLLRKLKEELKDKRFLFVLDDVWDDNYDHWEPLLSSVRSGAVGSKIIVTTRIDNVANKLGNVTTYRLEKVSDDDCWTLFKQHAFKDTSLDEHKDLYLIGKKIVEKCKGVPLAVKSLAGLLRSMTDPEEWEGILHDDIWKLEDSNILPSLWLSYHYLPSHLKRCFAYCSTFPKDYEMNEHRKEEIILLWMAEGLLQLKSGVKIEDVGKAYFQDLISRSLFQPLSTNKSTILMHDLTHDLAVFVSGEFSYRLAGEDKVKFPEKTRYFSYSADGLESFEGLSAAKSIRSYLQLSSHFYRSCTGRQELELLLSVGGRLRALSLSVNFRVLPHSIGNLKHLRHLDFSYSAIEEIPNTLCSLYNLLTLRLSGCHELTRLPTEMGNLVKLRHLDIEGVPLKKMPPNMRNLEDLQTLNYFVLCKTGGSNIKELSGLHHLSGHFKLLKLENVDVEDAREANLKDKGYLKELLYCWSTDDGIDNSKKDIEVLDARQPHTNLERLSISGYRGEAFFKWLGNRSYTKMVVVRLYCCHNLCKLPSLGELPSLQALEINSCPRVERIGVEFYHDGGSSNIKPFRSLKSLEFKDMEGWQEWSFPEVHEDGGCFPSLEELIIEDCEELQSVSGEMLPTSLTSLTLNALSKIEDLGKGLGHLTSLKKLQIYDCINVRRLSENGLPTSLTSLEIRSLESLEDIGGGSFRHLITLERLEILDCKNLQYNNSNSLEEEENTGKRGLQHLISLKRLDIRHSEGLQSLLEEGLPTSLTSLWIEGFPNLRDLNRLGFQHLNSLESLRICYFENLECLPEKGLPLSLSSLVICKCPLLNPRCQRGTGQDWHKISHIPNVRIDRD